MKTLTNDEIICVHLLLNKEVNQDELDPIVSTIDAALFESGPDVFRLSPVGRKHAAGVFKKFGISHVMSEYEKFRNE